MVAVQPKLATLASPSQKLPAAFDGGNGSIKLVVDLAEIRFPSYFLPIQHKLYDVPASIDGGLVEYAEGPRADLIGKTWLAGMPAYQQSPKGCLRTVDDRRGKLEYGLQLLLGGLATLRPQSVWNLALVASIQDSQAFGELLKERLEGLHTVRFNCSDIAHISIEVIQVVEEGVGAIVHARLQIDPNGQTVLYDFGAGTSIVSVFGAKGRLVDRKYSVGGVELLIDAIASNLDVRRKLAGEGDRQIIRAGIEDRSFLYGQTKWSFKHVYEAELKPWVISTLAPALKTADPWTPTSSAILAIGGGSQLPLIEDLLKSKGITPVEDGCWANARGMARIAYLKLRGDA